MLGPLYTALHSVYCNSNINQYPSHDTTADAGAHHYSRHHNHNNQPQQAPLHVNTPRPDLIKVREDLTTTAAATGANIGAATILDDAAAASAPSTAAAAAAPAVSAASTAGSSSHHHHHGGCQHVPNGPLDWTPQEKCYFCVDGKLLMVNEHGDLVPESGTTATGLGHQSSAAGIAMGFGGGAESGSGSSVGGLLPTMVQSAAARDLLGRQVSWQFWRQHVGYEMVKQIVCIYSILYRVIPQSLVDTDSDSSDSSDIAAVRNSLANSSVTSMLQKTLQQSQRNHAHQQSHQQQPTNSILSSFESMAAQFATIASLNGFQHMHPCTCSYPICLQLFQNPRKIIAITTMLYPFRSV